MDQPDAGQRQGVVAQPAGLRRSQPKPAQRAVERTSGGQDPAPRHRDDHHGHHLREEDHGPEEPEAPHLGAVEHRGQGQPDDQRQDGEEQDQDQRVDERRPQSFAVITSW